jgi:Domain of unknown function (DUF5753)
VASLSAVTIQVVSFSVGAHAGLCGHFTIMTFRDPLQPDVVYFEQVTRESVLEAGEDVRQYKTAFDSLSGAALPPDDSIAFIVALDKGAVASPDSDGMSDLSHIEWRKSS